MFNKDEETRKIPIINKQNSENTDGFKPQSSVRGFDPSKAMFIPSDKNAVHCTPKQPAVQAQNLDLTEKNSANSGDKDSAAAVSAASPEKTNTAESKPDNPKPDEKPVDENTVPTPVLNLEADPDVTAEIPVVESQTAKSDEIYNSSGTSDVYSAAAAPSAKKPKTSDSHNDKKPRKWVYAVCFSIFSVIVCAAVILSYVFPKIIEEGGAAILQNVSSVVGEPPKNVNVLLVGTDKGGYRTDTIMVASYDNDAEAVHIMQIPRDTYVKGNGRSDKKINSAYFSGIDTLKDEIFKAFGIEIHRYLTVELEGFVKLIDAIGGVEVDVPLNMHYDDPVQDLHIHIKKGPQLLDGKNAEGFVRYRKGNDGSSYPLGDIDRMKAQKQFLQSTVAKIVSVDGISKIPELIGIVKDNVDTDLSTSEATSYAAKILSLDSGKINFYTAPGVPLYKYGGWYYFIDGTENSTLVMNYFNGEHNKKSYSPVYFDLTEDPYESETASTTESEYDSADVSDDERYSYYSPEDDMGYYDDSAGMQTPVIDDDDEE